MADSNLAGLTPDTAPGADSLVYAVDDPAGTPADSKVTLGDAVTKGHGLSDGVVKIASGTMAPASDGTDYISSVAADTTPQLGGDLDAQTNDITAVDNIKLSAAPATPLTTEGALYYDATSKALAVKNDEADVTLQVGQENWVRVYNNSGGTISNGEVVYVSGKEDVEDRLTVAKAQADADITSKVLGFATHDIETATFGYVTQFGYINGVNTASFADGASVWLSPTTAGAITDTAPESPDNIVFLGYIVDSAVSGNIFITTLGNTSGSGVLISDATEIVQNARKGSAGTINKGQPVYISGYNTGQSVIEVELADSDNASAMPAVGIANDSITNATTGQVVLSGRVANIDTSAYSLGDSLYVDTTAGALTATRPTGPTVQIQKVATVARVNASTGVIIVVGAGRTNDQPNYHTDDIFRIADNTDTTKLIDFQASGITTGTTRTITMPDADIDLTNVPSSAEKTVLGNTSGTNTGDQTSVSGTSGNTDALNSATTVVDVSAATAPTTGQVLTATGTTAATWQTPAGGGGQTLYDYVLDAAGGGDYTDLSTALAAMSTGETLFIRNGNYVAVNLIEATGGLQLIGQSRDSVVLSMLGTTAGWAFNGDEMRFSNLTFQNYVGGQQLAFTCDNTIWENCRFYTNHGDTNCFNFSGTANSWVNNCLFDKSSGTADDRPIYVQVDNMTWTNNHFRFTSGSSSTSLGFLAITGTNHTITGNIFESSATSGTVGRPIISLTGGYNTVTGNTFNDGFSIEIGIYTTSDYNVISGNTFEGLYGMVNATSAADNLVISGNTYSSGSTAGTAIAALGNYTTITGNHLDGATGGTSKAIDFSTTGIYSTVTGNTIRDWDTAITLGAGANYNAITGNVLHNNTTDISDSGTGNLHVTATNSDPLNVII